MNPPPGRDPAFGLENRGLPVSTLTWLLWLTKNTQGSTGFEKFSPLILFHAWLNAHKYQYLFKTTSEATDSSACPTFQTCCCIYLKTYLLKKLKKKKAMLLPCMYGWVSVICAAAHLSLLWERSECVFWNRWRREQRSRSRAAKL